MTPWTAAHQAPPSMGFSRQECWSGVPLPSLSHPPRWSESTGLSSLSASLVTQSCPALCDPIDSSPPGSPLPGILQARTPTGLGPNKPPKPTKLSTQSVHHSRRTNVALLGGTPGAHSLGGERGMHCWDAQNVSYTESHFSKVRNLTNLSHTKNTRGNIDKIR